MHALIAIVLANLPRRWWGPFEERFPLYAYAWVSGIVTLMAGFATGIPGFLTFVQEVASGGNQALVDAQSEFMGARGWVLLALPSYFLATPGGLLSLYLVISGLARFATAFIADDPMGDWILTRLDDLAVKMSRDTKAWDARKTREKLEGTEVPDRLVTGDWLDRPDIHLAIVASRRKNWPRGSYLVSVDGRAYRVEEPFDLQLASGLRTVYPLVELKTGEAIRHAIPYELPALWRAPRL